MVRQLFERELATGDPRKRAELLAGPAGAAGELLAVGQAGRGGEGGARGMFPAAARYPATSWAMSK